MSEEQLKKVRLVAYWLFSTTVIVFAAVTAFIAIWVRPIGASMGQVLRAGLPIWGITALAAVVAFGGYYVYARRKV
jgi:sterol desaturase/sphingolipid hydroxylase (fatty acid hydroxylase superfamily)